MLVAAMMWNHGPQMAEAMRTRGIDRPTLEPTEFRDLIAYLKSESSASLAGPLYLLAGDARQGCRIFVDKRCIDCHRGGESGRSLIGRGVRRNLIQFATVMWNKAPVMMTTSKTRGVVTSWACEKPLFDHFAPLGEDVDLAFPLVHVDANMVHGWPLPFCGVDRGVLLWGSICPHHKREASRFIPSMLYFDLMPELRRWVRARAVESLGPETMQPDSLVAA